ncbi:MAG: hypothetical protein JW938_08065 [Candidatus Omnitrophica bacterium]|nr:hypothetical protein [Candidatus Omnitrophota bacterium]
MAKAAALKSAWIVISVVIIIQAMDSCEHFVCKAATLLVGAVLVAIGSWFIVKYTRK